MKFQKYPLLFFTCILVSCGSTERVITDDGTIYEVKGSTFKTNGEDVTDKLTDDEKEAIQEQLERKIEAREAAEKRQEELEERQEELERIQEAAEKKEKDLKKKQEALEERREALSEARDDFAKAKKRLQKKKEIYERRKEKGKLSPRDELKWQEKIKDLELEVKKAKQQLDKLKKS